MGEDARLDLAVVGAEQLMALWNDERLADAESILTLDGDVLKIRIGRRESPGRGDGLVQRGVEPFGFWSDKFGKGIDIG